MPIDYSCELTPTFRDFAPIGRPRLARPLDLAPRPGHRRLPALRGSAAERPAPVFRRNPPSGSLS